ncbi:hypothetical protein BDW59DRAFT_165921 [Aspergillus cavernicola]|uniref:WSC domain-containing protein n=1 Tax=Aspergillus cavernicola TaxID=176166 RepID=A0ABR4HS58_9EURO
MKFRAALFPVLSFALPGFAAQISNSIGCFSSPGNFENQGSFTFQEVNHCVDQCDEADFKYAALQGDDCWCGKADPAQADLISDDECDEACSGWPRDICGGDDAWSVYGIGGVTPDTWSSTTSTGVSTTTSTSTSEIAVTSSSTSSSSSTTSTTTSTSSETSAAVVSEATSTSSTPSSDNASSTPSSTSISTSVEATPTENSASRRFKILF